MRLVPTSPTSCYVPLSCLFSLFLKLVGPLGLETVLQEYLVSKSETSVHPITPLEGLPLGQLVVFSNGPLIVPLGAETLGWRCCCSTPGKGQGACSQPLHLAVRLQRQVPTLAPGSIRWKRVTAPCNNPPPSSLLSPPERYDVEKVRQTGEDQSLPLADDKGLAEMAKASFHATRLGKTDSNRRSGKGMGGESRGRKERPRKEQKVGRMT